MALLEETKIDKSAIYFHGSSEARVDKLDAPTFEHPFYVTPDLHYAMAFCTKEDSSTGEYLIKKTFTPSDQNYVYVVTLKPSCRVFDFRDHTSQEFKKLYKVIDQELVDWILQASASSGNDVGDIYEFTAALHGYMLRAVAESGANYLQYSKMFEGDPMQLPVRLFLKACDFCQKNHLVELYEERSIHRTMVPLLRGLAKQGFHGVLTREQDFNDETMPSTRVTTNYAIGLFDKAGLDLLSLVPMKYAWLKKINPSYLQNATAGSAKAKIQRFIKLYKKVSQLGTAEEEKKGNAPSMQIAESAIDTSATWYFGNNRAKNLRLSRPAWHAPLFLTTSYSYAEDYADYGVYSIDLKPEASSSNILDFNTSEVSVLDWPRCLVDKIKAGRNDLNSIAYDMYILAYGTGERLMHIDDSPAWKRAAMLFKKKSHGILKSIPRGASQWGDEKDHAFVLQMWKDIHDAGFDGFTHVEFGEKILALFDFKEMDKISIHLVQQREVG